MHSFLLLFFVFPSAISAVESPYSLYLILLSALISTTRKSDLSLSVLSQLTLGRCFLCYYSKEAAVLAIVTFFQISENAGLLSKTDNRIGIGFQVTQIKPAAVTLGKGAESFGEKLSAIPCIKALGIGLTASSIAWRKTLYYFTAVSFGSAGKYSYVFVEINLSWDG